MRKHLAAAVVVAAACTTAQVAQAVNLIGKWTFNEGGGTVAVDSSGNGNDAQLLSDLSPLGTPGYVSTGTNNLGVSLNPTLQQWINYGSSSLFTNASAFSLESWFVLRGSSNPGAEPMIFGRDHTLYGTTFYGNNGRSYSYLGSGSSYVATDPLNLNQTYHLVQTWDGSTITVYLDGVSVGSFSPTPTPPSDPTSLRTGKPGPSDGTGYLDMTIDEARIYDGALTPSQVAADFAAGPTQMSPQWIGQSGDWNNFSNWVGGVPNGVGSAAFFKGSISQARTVFTDIGVKVGTLSFDSPNTYVIAGAGSLSLEVASGSAAIDVINGSHKINLPLEFTSNTTITIANGQTLTLGNPTTIKANKTVTKTGNLTIQAPLIIETGGQLVLGPGASSVFGAPSLATGASIDVQNRSLTVDYRGQSSPATTIKNQLKSGYNNGAWNGEGLKTSSGSATTGLGWRDNAGSSSIEVKYAYYGDANLDGTVNSVDFNALAGKYGTSNSVWTDGDFNYDGKVNTLDFNQLAGNFNKTLPAPLPSSGLGSVVPEPSVLAMALIPAIAAMRRRRC